ncbi:MAG: hypothetical protein U0573_11710 [Phycisphaerales bacterium]|nr:hypothetical protein [Planctomycetota bacterium]
MTDATHTPANSSQPGVAQGRSRPTPLHAVYGFTFINSLSAGLVTSGIYVITAEGFGFSALQNFLLGVMLGVTYIAGALGAQPFTQFLRRSFPFLNGRAILIGIMLCLGALSSLPALVCGFGRPDRALGGQWSVWLMVALYSPLTGVLWPMVESFLSGGRRDRELRGAIGLWNVIWSSSLVVGSWAVSGFVRQAPGTALVFLGSIQVVSIAFLSRFPREPGEHITEAHGPVPPLYADLLTTFRVLLPASYVVSSALGPILPLVCTAAGVPPEWQMVVTTAWLLPRCLGFLSLERWHAWHGRWAAPVTGGLLVAAGFALTIGAWALAERAAAPGLNIQALSVLLAGLACFGIGMSVIYAGAIYYAMEVGAAEVEAGGMHEALIGVGYTGGPMLGVMAVTLQRAGVLSDRGVSTFLLVGVLCVLTLAATLVAKRVHAGHKKHRPVT